MAGLAIFVTSGSPLVLVIVGMAAYSVWCVGKGLDG